MPTAHLYPIIITFNIKRNTTLNQKWNMLSPQPELASNARPIYQD